MGVFYKSVKIPSDLLEALGDDAGHSWSDPAIEPIIHDAIRAWLNRSSAPQSKPSASTDTGFQWKQLFLPEGTRLRAAFKGVAYFADVRGAQIMCGDQSLSPSRFANLHGSGNRNAWQAIWLRFPAEEQWLLADSCREMQLSASQLKLRRSADCPGIPHARGRGTCLPVDGTTCCHPGSRARRRSG